MIETMNEYERCRLYGFAFGAKALRIIDSQAAALARVRALAAPLLDEVVGLRDALAGSPAAPLFQTPEEMGGQDAHMQLHRDLAAANARIAELEKANGELADGYFCATSTISKYKAVCEERETEWVAANARIAELEREASEWKANWQNATNLVEQHRRDALTEAGHAIQSEDALNAANARADLAEAFHKVAVQQRDTARTEAAALRAEVERLRVSEGKAWDEARASGAHANTARRSRERQTAALRDTESSLAAANALLARLPQPGSYIGLELRDAVSAHLAACAAPATATEKP